VGLDEPELLSQLKDDFERCVSVFYTCMCVCIHAMSFAEGLVNNRGLEEEEAPTSTDFLLVLDRSNGPR
jgi:hypothetical protein